MSQLDSYSPRRYLPSLIGTFLLVIGVVILPEDSMAEAAENEGDFSEHYSMRLHQDAVKKTGEEEFKGIVNFFHHAERAIESEDIDALMSLYSSRYTNLNGQNRDSAREIWQKIFDNFDNLSARHSMRLLTYQDTETNQIAVTECNGLLSGIPKGEDTFVTIDSWDRQRHILTKEGSWKLFGNAGKGSKRYGEDKFKTHPLF